MKDTDIIKALDYCSKQGITSECERCTVGNGCRSELIISALDLINRQKAEIERLDKCREINVSSIATLHQELKTAKSEAIKEFAERLKKLWSMPDGEIVCRTVYTDEIDNLVKEMTEGNGND